MGGNQTKKKKAKVDQVKGSSSGESPMTFGGISGSEAKKEPEKPANPWFLVAGFGLLLAILITAQFGQIEQEDATGWVLHTADVETEIRQLLSDLQDAETGQRGFLLTAEEPYLDPYNYAVTQTPTTLANLRQLTLDNPRQQERINQVEVLIEEKFAELDETIELRRTEGLEAALVVVRSDVGKAVMDQIRALISTMATEEEVLLESRQERTSLVAGFITVFEGIGFVALIGVSFFAFQQLKRSIGLHKEAREELIIYSEGLEDTITQRTADLKRSNDELEQFAYVASHDLKAPLRAIDNLSQWIEEDLGDVLKGETKKNMTLLRGRVSRLETLLDDILAYSRAGRIQGKFHRHDVNELVKEVVSFLDVPKGFKVKTIGHLPTVNAPKGTLDQIFGNLINNALKHHDKKTGTISISAKDLEDGWEFFVADDGPGIAPEFRDRIFRMFQKLEGRDKAEGSGMGLAIVKKLVRAQGGEIGFDSDPEKKRGTTFHFTWRLVQPEV